MTVYSTHLLDLLDTLELDEEDNGEDLVMMQALHGPKMDVQNAMLALPKHKKTFKNEEVLDKKGALGKDW
jgi:hypothetical protein